MPSKLMDMRVAVGKAQAHDLPVTIRLVNGYTVSGMVTHVSIDPDRKVNDKSVYRSNLLVTVNGTTFPLEDVDDVTFGT